MSTIVKVQRPLFPPDGPWLIYDRQRNHVERRDALRIRRVKDQGW